MSGAAISIDGMYRYSLTRSWWDGNGRKCVFIMLNPSTADATKDDPTIRRCIGFAKRFLCDTLEVVNLFAYRATDPEDLVRFQYRHDVVGPENDRYILDAKEDASVVIAAWGAHYFARDRAKKVTSLICGDGHYEMFCLGKTKDGSPRHPLYVKKDVDLVRYA